MSPRANRAWKLAHGAACAVIACASNLRRFHEIRLRVRAERLLAESFLPAAALVVQAGGTRFDVVDSDAAECVQDLYRQWGNDVVDACRRIP